MCPSLKGESSIVPIVPCHAGIGSLAIRTNTLSHRPLKRDRSFYLSIYLLDVKGEFIGLVDGMSKVRLQCVFSPCTFTYYPQGYRMNCSTICLPTHERIEMIIIHKVQLQQKYGCMFIPILAMMLRLLLHNICLDIIREDIK